MLGITNTSSNPYISFNGHGTRVRTSNLVGKNPPSLEGALTTLESYMLGDEYRIYGTFVPQHILTAIEEKFLGLKQKAQNIDPRYTAYLMVPLIEGINCRTHNTTTKKGKNHRIHNIAIKKEINPHGRNTTMEKEMSRNIDDTTVYTALGTFEKRLNEIIKAQVG